MKNIFKLLAMAFIVGGTLFSCNRYRAPDTPDAIEDRAIIKKDLCLEWVQEESSKEEAKAEGNAGKNFLHK